MKKVNANIKASVQKTRIQKIQVNKFLESARRRVHPSIPYQAKYLSWLYIRITQDRLWSSVDHENSIQKTHHQNHEEEKDLVDLDLGQK